LLSFVIRLGDDAREVPANFLPERNMHNVKFGVLLFGLLGLIAVFLPFAELFGHSKSLWAGRAGDAAQVYMVMGGFAVALAMGAMGAAKGMQRWMSIVALIGFAFVLLKIRDGLPFKMLKEPYALGGKLMFIAVVLGIVCSILALAKPEPAK
jgi:hypothetical protein